MGYAFMIAPCLLCKRPFTFNPVKVPSFRIKRDGPKEPLCQSCMDMINRERVKKGAQPFEIAPDAYEACDENDLP